MYFSTVVLAGHGGQRDQIARCPVEEALPMPADPVTTDRPKRPLPELTTYELRDYRRELESAIAFFDKQDPVPPARDRLQATLDAVRTEQEERARIAAG
jgi:hypothetical protein